MKLEMFIDFDGNCRHAVEFYAGLPMGGMVEDKFGIIWQISYYKASLAA